MEDIMKKSLGAHTYLPTTPVLLVGTYDQQGKPNMMTAAWGGICCSKPPCVAVSLRKATYSYSAIVERKAFTIGIPMESQIEEADYLGLVSGRKVDKFAEIGFSAVKSDLVDAPYAEELPFIIECNLLESIELGLHTLFVGEIVDVKADEKVLAEDGLPDITKVKPFIFDPIHQGYIGLGSFLGKAFSVGKRK
jgi:flavin reductase (DIM6/NTAB) family NADH-FMN oxidoreductase RutF